jgi:hypothetical protein
VNDQRHRWVTSAVFMTGAPKSGDGAWRHFIGGFTFAPLIEVASGRPFNVITGTDTRLDLGASEARPSLVSSGGTTSPFIPGVQFGEADVCLTNSGGTVYRYRSSRRRRAASATWDEMLYRTAFFQIDMRLSKRIPLGERWSIELIATASTC